MTIRRAMPRARNAFTLIEVVLATSILAVVGVTVSSVLMVAARSSPPAASGSATDVAISDALAIMSIDVGLAGQFLATEATYTAFVGSDANGDAVPDEIGYARGVDLGGQLLRLVDGELSVMYTGVPSMTLTYQKDSVTIKGVTSTVVRSVGVKVSTADGSTYRRTIRCVGLPKAP